MPGSAATDLPVPRPDSAAGPATAGRVLIVTASMGAGHTEVAAQLARELTESGRTVDVVDVLALSRTGALARAAYRSMLRFAPRAYAAVLHWWARAPRLCGRLIALLSGPACRALRATVREVRPGVVVSTYNLASQCLGRLADRGRLPATLVTVVSDPGAHPYWVHRRTVRHVAALPTTAARLRAMGAADVRVARPPLRPEFGAPPDRDTARRRLHLPGAATIVVVSAGAWAAGQVRRSVRDLRHVPGLTVIALCGRDDRLRRELAADGVHAVGWTGAMVDYLCAADLLLDNAGGLTCWEALACGTPVVLYRPLPGHGVLNALALEDAGLATYARSARGLRSVLRADPARRPDPWAGAAPTAAVVAEFATVREAGGAGA